MLTYHRGRLTFPVLDAGPADAEHTVVLLHGFPQTSAAWSTVTPTLAAAGLRTLAPDTRGTARRARPPRRRDYRIDELVADVLALIDQAGLTRAHLVGHDWGAGIAWEIARRHPERIVSLTALSVPHPAAMVWASRNSTQAWRSSYMLPMQIPLLPEHLGAAAIRRGALGRLGLPPEHVVAYTRRFSDPAALAGALGPYRALPVDRSASSGAPHVTVPTTFVWGDKDPYLGRAGAERTARYCRGPYRFAEVDADHWLPEKEPQTVAREILARVGSA